MITKNELSYTRIDGEGNEGIHVSTYTEVGNLEEESEEPDQDQDFLLQEHAEDVIFDSPGKYE